MAKEIGGARKSEAEGGSSVDSRSSLGSTEGGAWRTVRQVPDARYIYEVRLADSDVGILNWHWHPLTTSERLDPHVHVELTHPDLAGTSFPKLHVPSGRVGFEEVVHFLIEDLEVEPARDDWRDRLHESLVSWREFRSWA
jgi:hypothetical protein